MKTMNLYSSIFTRASTRKFDANPLSAETLKGLEEFISSVKPLLPDVKLSHRIVDADAVKGLALPKAPHFLIISGEAHPLRNTAAGFLYQHAELYLYSKGFAARWLAGVKSKQADPNHIVGFAFGKPTESGTRKPQEFARKSVGEIAKGTDKRLEAVRLAPSGMNGQPWYFIVDGNSVHVYYKQSLGGLTGKFYHLTDLDAGLALCHMAVASEHEGMPFRFEVNRKLAPTPPKDFTYLGTVE